MPSHLNEQIETEPVLAHLIHRHTPHVDRLAETNPTWAPTEIVRMRCANSKLSRVLDQQDPHLRIVVGHAHVVEFIREKLVRSQEDRIAEEHSFLALQRYRHGSSRHEEPSYEAEMENHSWIEDESAIDLLDSDDESSVSESSVTESSVSEDYDEWSSDDEGTFLLMENDMQASMRLDPEEKRRAASISAEPHGGFQVEVTELDPDYDP